MPEDMPDRMADRTPDKMPENRSDRMPEDLPGRKCINAMVGIIRSEVFFLTKSVRMPFGACYPQEKVKWAVQYMI
jgi:hypothetical protein